MKAVRYHSYGDTDVLVHEDVERPVAGPGQVVVRVAGSAFNPLDAAIRAGFMQGTFDVAFPHVPNYDVAGVVAEVGDGVAGWQTGDEVVAFLPPTAPGAAAEYVAAPAELLARAPRNVELADAAVLPSTGLTAFQALFEHADLQAGQRILVNSAGGAVGGYAVQLAAKAGAAVTATASARSADRLRSYGVDQIVDHTAAPVPDALRGQRFDVLLNLVRTSTEDAARLVELVADGGVYVSATGPGAESDRVRAVQVFVHPDMAQLADLVARVDAGELKIDVADRRPLSELAKVHHDAAAGQLAGKTVLLP